MHRTVPVLTFVSFLEVASRGEPRVLVDLGQSVYRSGSQILLPGGKSDQGRLRLLTIPAIHPCWNSCYLCTLYIRYHMCLMNDFLIRG